MMLIINNLGGAKIKFRKGPIIVAETILESTRIL